MSKNVYKLKLSKEKTIYVVPKNITTISMASKSNALGIGLEAGLLINGHFFGAECVFDEADAKKITKKLNLDIKNILDMIEGGNDTEN